MKNMMKETAIGVSMSWLVLQLEFATAKNVSRLETSERQGYW